MKEYVLKEFNDGSKITVRDVQLVILEIAKEIDRVCEKNNIPYFLNGGSALGAIRHQGFIPWDDDFDIAVLRKDYERFIEALQKDLSHDYTFQCFETDKRYNVTLPAMKIRKKNTYVKEANFLLPNKCTDCDGIFVDVFIYNYVSKSKLIDYPFRFVNQYLLMPIIVLLENLHMNPKILKKAFIGNACFYGKLSKNSPYLGYELTWVYRKMTNRAMFKYEELFPIKRVTFEDTTFPTANDDKAYVSADIGPDYMTLPPEKKRTSKHIVDVNLNGSKPEN